MAAYSSSPQSKTKARKKFLVRILCSQTFHFCLLFTESPLRWSKLPATGCWIVEQEVKNPIGNSGLSRDNSSCLASVFARLFYPPFSLHLNRDGEWGFTLSLNMQFCVKFTGRRSVWQRTLRVRLPHIFRLSSASFPPNYWLFYFSTELGEHSSRCRKWVRLGRKQWGKRSWLAKGRSRLGGECSHTGHAHRPSWEEVKKT